MIQDKVLTHDWLAAAYAESVTYKPIQVMLLGERIVLFRTKEGVHAFKDLCIHRGAALSGGKVVNDCLVCPYHGWEYNADGKCVKIPQQPPERVIPPKAKTVKYGCIEKYGIIWVDLSNSLKETDLPDYGEFSDSDFKTVGAPPYVMHAAAPRVVENFLDVSHLAFVHDGSLGDHNYPLIPNYRVYWKGNRYVSDEIPVYADADATGNYATLYYTYEILRPTTARLKKVNRENGEILSMLFTVVPHHERKTTVLALVSRNYNLDQSDEYYKDFQNIIIMEDAPVVENQRPEELPLDLQAELHLPADRVSIAYRKWLGELGITFGSDVSGKVKKNVTTGESVTRTEA
ncbi:aromatic ring-hydroxylating dioxygenase subunit alpha [Sporolactobacillus sp. THM7-7]|nr:aromatic ring-hydroxylating dioxygenase subunit alpha [Sporolactobacillus sp. THM7-7]